ncbi:MAG: amino acid-binding protein [Proteobacteria bacterium]|nr:amino acid-binding protein [Pseudomonadota bacterium]MBU1686488.1 amino acid-binding protein [Pseudomonadota bacterium]
MNIKQIVVTIEGDADQVSEVAELLAENGINIIFISLPDHCPSQPKLLRLIVNDVEKGNKILMQRGIKADLTDVVVAEIPDKPGGMARILTIIKKSGLINHALQAYSQRSGECGLVVINFPSIDYAITQLSQAGVRILSIEELLAR